MEYLRNSMKLEVNNIKVIKSIDYKLSIENDLFSKKESKLIFQNQMF